jgi:hypothetical protein
LNPTGAAVHYLRSYRFVFNSSRWLANVGFVSLCMLSTAVIPLVGQMVAVGYLFDMIESMHRYGDDRDYPPFQGKWLVDYLARGALVFLVEFLGSLPVSVIFLVGYLGGLFILIPTLLSSPNPDLTLLVWWMVGWIALMVFAGLLLNVLLAPVILRAGLSQSLGTAFSLTFTWDYLRRMWWPTVKAELFLMVAGVVVGFVGLLVCFVGIYAASTLSMFARHHLYYQLYEMYLERGGMPIPLQQVEQMEEETPLLRAPGGSALPPVASENIQQRLELPHEDKPDEQGITAKPERPAQE